MQTLWGHPFRGESRSRPHALSVLIFGCLAWWGCDEQTPAFEEQRQTVRINLVVDPAMTDSSQSAREAVAELPSDAEVDGVFDDLLGDEGSGEGNAVASDGSAKSKTEASSSKSSSGSGGHSSKGAATAGTEQLAELPPEGSTTTPPSPGTEGPVYPGDPTTPGNEPELSLPERQACAKLQGVSTEVVRVISETQSLSRIGAQAVLAFKLTGNRARLELNLDGGEGAAIAGICLFVTGNEGEAMVKLGLPTGRLIYLGRGNQSRADVEVKATGSLEFIAADLAGNRSSLHVWGEGSHPCVGARLRNRSATFTCQ